MTPESDKAHKEAWDEFVKRVGAIESRWKELKTWLEGYKKFERDDYGRGWNHAMGVVIEKMKILEEEK